MNLAKFPQAVGKISRSQTFDTRSQTHGHRRRHRNYANKILTKYKIVLRVRNSGSSGVCIFFGGEQWTTGSHHGSNQPKSARTTDNIAVRAGLDLHSELRSYACFLRKAITSRQQAHAKHDNATVHIAVVFSPNVVKVHRLSVSQLQHDSKDIATI